MIQEPLSFRFGTRDQGLRHWKLSRKKHNAGKYTTQKLHNARETLNAVMSEQKYKRYLLLVLNSFVIMAEADCNILIETTYTIASC